MKEKEKKNLLQFPVKEKVKSSGIKEWLLERIKERSTWLSLIGILAMVGIEVSPESQESILRICLLVASAIGIVTKDKKEEVKNEK